MRGAGDPGSAAHLPKVKALAAIRLAAQGRGGEALRGHQEQRGTEYFAGESLATAESSVFLAMLAAGIDCLTETGTQTTRPPQTGLAGGEATEEREG